MNERIQQLAKQIVCFEQDMDGSMEPNEDGQWIRVDQLEKFAELIVRECINMMLNSDDELFLNLEGWDLGGPNHDAWTRGVLDSVAVVKEHFGVK